MISMFLGNILSSVGHSLRIVFRRGGRAGAGSGAGKTAIQGIGSTIVRANPEEILGDEYREEPPRGIEAAMFRQLPRPRLMERSASELTLEQANEYSDQARRFYHFAFPLFPRGDFFYEEIEEDFINDALGYGDESIDKRFVDVATIFRRTLNANTRSLMLFWGPLLTLLAFCAAWALGPAIAAHYFPTNQSPFVTTGAIYAGVAIVSACLSFLVFSWPYKVVQQRNLLNLDNYITSKFARINNNFQVAKRRALNVERDKRMSERDALRDEARSWTMAYHWFAMRLFLCETMLRNKFYQVRRNTTLYWVAGLACSTAVIGLFSVLEAVRGGPLSAMGVLTAGFVSSLLVWPVLAGATPMMFGVLESNEWSRFGRINLDTTIGDHVGEDKLQIVTFRDRNRFE